MHWSVRWRAMQRWQTGTAWSHRSFEVRHGSQEGCWPFLRRGPVVAMYYIGRFTVVIILQPLSLGYAVVVCGGEIRISHRAWL